MNNSYIVIRLLLLSVFIASRGIDCTDNHTNIKVETTKLADNTKIRFCDIAKGSQEFDILSKTIAGGECTYLQYTCFNIGARSELSLWCNALEKAENWLADNGTKAYSDDVYQYTLSVARDQKLQCESVLVWNKEGNYCGCQLQNFSSLHVEYENMAIGDFKNVGEPISLKCNNGRQFPDYTDTREILCSLEDADISSLNCKTEAQLKQFDNKVAHFEGTNNSYVIVQKPFSEELSKLALCFWLKTKDAVGTIFSLVNEDHFNALRFDTHMYHVHFTMVGLHTDHGYVPKIVLTDNEWRYFCANWDNSDGRATIFVRKHGELKDKTTEVTGILPLSVGKTVRATGGKLALGNLWKENLLDTDFNTVGSFEGDIMGLTLFKTTVDIDTFNKMVDDCSTTLKKEDLVLTWKGLLNQTANKIKVSTTFGQQVCSKGYRYGSNALDFPFDSSTHLSNFVQNYAKIENAFSVDLSELTICTIIKSTIKIGTIFSYVINNEEQFSEELVLEKHKTHMHFYMAGIDQQVGAVPQIPIDDKRWYSTCFTWESGTGRWRGYLDGQEIPYNNKAAVLDYSVGKKVHGGGTCYLGILKTQASFRKYRGYGGDITELNLWGKALTPGQISEMVKRNNVYSENLLVSWGTLHDNVRGTISKITEKVCMAPPQTIGNGTGSLNKKTGKLQSTLYLIGETVEYSCLGTSVVAKKSMLHTTKTCSTDGSWTPVSPVTCQLCEEAELFECPAEKCLDLNKVCDGNKDCKDGSDEEECSKKGTYWIIIGVLAAMLVLVVPSVFFLRKARKVRAEVIRVKKLTDKWEVKREHLELSEKLGEGAFGKVFKGFLLRKPDYDNALTVAVKELSDVATERDKNMFLEEIRLSKKLGNHPNIVGIVGSIIVYEPHCLILEFVDGGDLLNFVQKNKNGTENILTQEDQVFFAWQIANGMEYVSGKNFVHRDLAARNVLISTKKQCKVTDFGLARDLYNYDEYQSEGGRLPIKWMSPEAIFELKFTTESDVWSYGILIYELFSWGGSPYPGVEPSQLRDRLVNGFRMAAPDGTPDFIYTIMLQCWEFKAEDRPKFTTVRSFIGDFIKDFDLFIKFKEQVAVEYPNLCQEYFQTTEKNSTISNTDDKTPLVRDESSVCKDNSAINSEGEEYKNITFTNKSAVKYTSPDIQLSPSAQLKSHTSDSFAVDIRPDPEPVNMGVLGKDGKAELNRTGYMNT